MDLRPSVASDATKTSHVMAMLSHGHQVDMTKREWMEAFGCLDLNGCGSISRKEWHLRGGETAIFDQIGSPGTPVLTKAKWASAYLEMTAPDGENLEEEDEEQELEDSDEFHSPSESSDLSGSSSPPRCRMRIIQINDIYILDNLPSLKTLIEQESIGFPPENVVKVCPGDFLAPSLLSSLDAGRGMVEVLNLMPIDIVCFGNHDGNDIPYASLVQRIDEFDGTWLNSNMPNFQPMLKECCLRPLTGEDGKEQARLVAFTGFCLGGEGFKIVNRADSFGGAAEDMIAVNTAAPAVREDCFRMYEGLDEVIALTHQSLKEDRELADMGLFPVICGGHDHMWVNEERYGTTIVKAGQDAEKVAVIDLEWFTDFKDETPQVTVTMKSPHAYLQNPAVVATVNTCNNLIEELNHATLFVLPPGEQLSSINARRQDISLAGMLAAAVRDCLQCDAAVINSGAVRGNKTYHHSLSYGDLTNECPFSSELVVVDMPFKVFRDAVKESRRKWWDIPEGASPGEAASSLQVDDGVRIRNHTPISINEEDPEEGKLYSVAVDTYVLRRNVVFKQYGIQHPDRIPPDDCGRPLVPILVEHFCAAMWAQIIDKATNLAMKPGAARDFRVVVSKGEEMPSGKHRKTVTKFFNRGAKKIFKEFDANGNGQIEAIELRDIMTKHLGPEFDSEVVTEQLMHMADKNGDGVLDLEEFNLFMKATAPHVDDSRDVPTSKAAHAMASATGTPHSPSNETINLPFDAKALNRHSFMMAVNSEQSSTRASTRVQGMSSETVLSTALANRLEESSDGTQLAQGTTLKPPKHFLTPGPHAGHLGVLLEDDVS